MAKHIAIAIIGFRNVFDIRRCLVALEKCTYTDFEIVICENGGSAAFLALRDAVPTSLRGGQRITLIQAVENGGYAQGINTCIASSSHAVAWWLLNPDTEPMPDALSALVDRLERGCDAVGGTLYFPSGRVQSYGGIWRGWLARAVSIGNGNDLSAEPDVIKVEKELSYLSGASMLVSRAFVERAGPMSEDFFLYCEEVDWCLRAKTCGLKLGFAPDARILHHQGTTTGRSTDLKTRSWLSVYLDERNKMLLTRRHFPWRLPVTGLAAFLLIGLRYVPRGAIRQFFYGVSGWSAGLCGKQGKPRMKAEPTT